MYSPLKAASLTLLQDLGFTRCVLQASSSLVVLLSGDPAVPASASCQPASVSASAATFQTRSSEPHTALVAAYVGRARIILGAENSVHCAVTLTPVQCIL